MATLSAQCAPTSQSTHTLLTRRGVWKSRGRKKKHKNRLYLYSLHILDVRGKVIYIIINNNTDTNKALLRVIVQRGMPSLQPMAYKLL